MEKLPSKYESRLDTLTRLSEALGVPLPEISARGLRIESQVNDTISTLRAEIEVGWPSVLPDYDEWSNEPYSSFSDEKKAAFNLRCDELDAQLQPLYQAATQAGVPKGNDAYHEFAHRHVNWHETLSAEIAMLMKAGLIPEGHDHALHLTLGGIIFDKDVGIAAGTIELYGGSNQGRLTSPTDQSLSWARAGTCGIKPRRPEELEGSHSDGVEIRTLIACTPEQIGKTLRCAQLLGTTIRAHQFGHRDAIGRELASSWLRVRDLTVNDILVPHGLNCWWSNPVRCIDQWQAFSGMYGTDEWHEYIGSIRSELDYIEELVAAALESPLETAS